MFREPPLSLILENKKIAVFHEPDLIEGHIKDNQDTNLILHGHTHRYKEEIIDGIIYFNPGESAGSMEGKSAIGLIDMGNLNIKRIFF